MYLRRLSIATGLGLAWYFSDCGRTVTQYCVCLLLCCCAPLLYANSGRESGTQTDEEAEKLWQGRAEEELLDGDEAQSVGSHYPHVKKALQQVFECAYAQLVLPWYGGAELCLRQPLHQVLSREVDAIIERVIQRARDFNVCQAVVGSIRILSQHLRNTKQPDRELLFTSRAEEFAVLREFSDALVRSLFPKSLWGQEVHRCALNEVVAMKGLGLLVTWLSDPDNLNQLVVSQLDSVTPKGSVEELCGSDQDLTSLASQEGEASEVATEETGNTCRTKAKLKRKGNKFKVGWIKMVDKMKSKKAKKKKVKKMEQELVMRIMAIQENADEASSREGSIHSLHDSDREDSDLESYLASVEEDMMEFKLSYEMWRVGRWAVSIPLASWEDDRLTLTVHLEEKDSPENLQWDIKKTYMDIVYFRNRWQDSAILPVVMELEDSEMSKELKEKARASVEHFLQELVSDNVIGHTQPVFQFLCPLDKLLNEDEHYGGVWGLLSGLAYFLTPGQEEEESPSPELEAAKEAVSPSLNADSAAAPSVNPRASAIPTIVISQHDNTPSEEPERAELEEEEAAAALTAGETLTQDKKEDSDNPLTSHFKMIFKGLRRSKSQESLASAKTADDEELQREPDAVPHCSQNGGLAGEGAEGPSWRHFHTRSLSKAERATFKLSGGVNRGKGKEQGTLPRADDPQRSQVNWEQLEATKAIFDLLKEISGNSILINIFDAILKPVMPILKKKVNSFLDKMNPTEEQMASYIDTMREKQWPEVPRAAPSAPRTEEEKSESRERAHNLISAKYSNYLVLKKTDMDSVFNLFQDREENKTLVYMLLSFLLREFLPNEHSLSVSAAALQKVTNSSS
ncbi:uncharacterized protein LOC142901815 [Nelusetta ayraudi]|uniref:uncharacterized protein LOC142901815 n=1 Tax=Nelusetta ayraudi TaxID=303726 RepID=UPI003F71C390